MKWGVGVDNVDFAAFKDLGLPVENTPGVFGGEVADVALTYTLGLARETYRIDREIREKNAWPKPSGISMTGRTVALVGFGDIGRQTAKRILACGSNVVVYDPFYKAADGLDVETAQWPQRLDEADFLIFTCPLTPETRGMFNADILGKLRPGVRVINVARGPVIQETALLEGLKSGIVHSAALDVFEVEPLPGLHLGHRVIPLERVGCYVPGGRYPLLSAPVMTIVPAKVAGVFPRIRPVHLRIT